MMRNQKLYKTGFLGIRLAALGFVLVLAWGLGTCRAADSRQETKVKELPSPSHIPDFDGRSAYQFLVKQCDFGPRNPGSRGQVECRDYLVATLRKFADEVTIQPFEMTFGSPPTRAEAFNIIAKFQPAQKKRILLCAHWDTRPWADEDPEPAKRNTPILGANDGGSGVAVLLELAGILHQHKPPVGIDIVLFDGEDAGTSGVNSTWIQGSTYFARNLKPGYSPQYGILLDMIGDADLNVHIEAYSWQHARPVVEKVWRKAMELGLSGFKPDVKYQMLDDHWPLNEAGIPCIDLIDFDYPYWHTSMDTPDKCSSGSLEQIGTLMVHLIFSEEK